MRRVIAGAGRLVLTVGILILLFVAYQLWGTGIYTDRQQSALRDEFNAALRHQGPSPTTTSGPTIPPPTTPKNVPLPAEGEAVAELRIPKIGLDAVVVNGVNVDDLRKGPGLYPDTPLPGQEGNAAIAGHRTTYSAPFGDIDKLTTGDEITVRTVQGTFTYDVYDKLVVNPSDLSVLRQDPGTAILTLTTCNPKFSAAQRLVVKAALQPGQTPFPARPSARPGSGAKLADLGLSGESGSKLPTVIAGVIAAIIGLAWWRAFLWRPRPLTWFVGVVPFLVSLFFFYQYLERLLPSSF